jgi:hypothetical protein
MVNLAMSPMLILEDFWIASGRIWSDGDRTLLTEALKLDPTGIDRPHPDNRRDDLGGVHRFCKHCPHLFFLYPFSGFVD